MLFVENVIVFRLDSLTENRPKYVLFDDVRLRCKLWLCRRDWFRSDGLLSCLHLLNGGLFHRDCFLSPRQGIDGGVGVLSVVVLQLQLIHFRHCKQRVGLGGQRL